MKNIIKFFVCVAILGGFSQRGEAATKPADIRGFTAVIANNVSLQRIGLNPRNPLHMRAYKQAGIRKSDVDYYLAFNNGGLPGLVRPAAPIAAPPLPAPRPPRPAHQVHPIAQNQQAIAQVAAEMRHARVQARWQRVGGRLRGVSRIVRHWREEAREGVSRALRFERARSSVLQGMARNLQNMNNTLRGDLRLSQEEVNRLQRQLGELNRRSQELEQVNARIGTELADAVAALRNAHAQNQQQQGVIDRLNGDLERALTDLDVQQRLYRESETQREELHRIINRLLEELGTKDAETNELRAAKDRMTALISQLEVRFNDLRQANTQLKNLLERSQALSEQLAAENQELKVQNAALRQDMDQLLVLLQRVQRDNADKDSIIAQMIELSRDAEARIDALKKAAREGDVNMRLSRETYIDQIRGLQQQVRNLEANGQLDRAQIYLLKRMVDGLNAKITDLERALAEEKYSGEGKSGIIEKLTQQVARLEKQNHALRMLSGGLNGQIAKLEDYVKHNKAMSDGEIRALGDRIEELQTTILQLQAIQALRESVYKYTDDDLEAPREVGRRTLEQEITKREKTERDLRAQLLVLENLLNQAQSKDANQERRISSLKRQVSQLAQMLNKSLGNRRFMKEVIKQWEMKYEEAVRNQHKANRQIQDLTRAAKENNSLTEVELKELKATVQFLTDESSVYQQTEQEQNETVRQLTEEVNALKRQLQQGQISQEEMARMRAQLEQAEGDLRAATQASNGTMGLINDNAREITNLKNQLADALNPRTNPEIDKVLQDLANLKQRLLDNLQAEKTQLEREPKGKDSKFITQRLGAIEQLMGWLDRNGASRPGETTPARGRKFRTLPTS